MALYVDEVKTDKKYQGNVVIRIGGQYFASRLPDSGLFIPWPASNCVNSLVLNPTQISPKNVTTTISSAAFKLLDKMGIISRMVKDKAADLVGSDVDIWLGRSGTGMSFSEYYQLPTTRLSKVGKPSADQLYSFATRDATDRLNRPIYDQVTRLNGDIVAETTIILAKDDISGFAAAGTFQLDSELISYTSKNDLTKTFSGCERGSYGTIPIAHDDNAEIDEAQGFVNINPLTLLLQLLISGGGGGPYDVLDDGLGISQTLIDVAGIEALRDDKFADVSFTIALYNVPNALRFIEQQILSPCNVRFSFSRSSLLTLALLDNALFVDEPDILDHDTLTAEPTADISDTEIINKISVDWQYNEGTGQYLQKSIYTDAASIASYGLCTSPLTFQWKGVQEQSFVDDFAARLLERLSTPSPTISAKAQIDKSLSNLGEKTTLITNTLANEFGDLNFAYDLEIVSRAINWETGDVTFKLMYTSFTNQRVGYIAPSDQIVSVGDQSTFDVDAGRGSYWQAGWKVRLYDTVIGEYTSDAVNEIESIVGDTITFVDPWVTVLTTDLRLSFADYDQATTSQRRYAFVSINNQDFARLEKQYTIAP